MDYLQYVISFKAFIKASLSFKPCYKWITFNTLISNSNSISLSSLIVLNLVINGLPSIRNKVEQRQIIEGSFKPCYKWITFNT